jgi:uncharacterized protein
LQINIANIPEEGLKLRFSKGEDWFDNLIPKKDTSGFSVYSVDVDCSVNKVLKNVTVEGRICAGTEIECCRCLARFDYPVEADYKYIFAPATGDLKEEFELAQEDLDFGFYREESIDLDQILAEQIILQIPIKPLCKDFCKGICPTCGINLNEGQCDHKKDDIKGPFAVLKNFKVKKER